MNGSVILNNGVARNKTINIAGMLVVNGNFTTNASGMTLNVTDPGDGKAGIFVQSNISNNSGRWSINGVVFASGNVTCTNSDLNTINGGLVAGGSISINVGMPMTITYNPARVTSSFGAGSQISVEVQHWEEEY